MNAHVFDRRGLSEDVCAFQMIELNARLTLNLRLARGAKLGLHVRPYSVTKVRHEARHASGPIRALPLLLVDLVHLAAHQCFELLDSKVLKRIAVDDEARGRLHVHRHHVRAVLLEVRGDARIT